MSYMYLLYTFGIYKWTNVFQDFCLFYFIRNISFQVLKKSTLSTMYGPRSCNNRVVHYRMAWNANIISKEFLSCVVIVNIVLNFKRAWARHVMSFRKQISTISVGSSRYVGVTGSRTTSATFMRTIWMYSKEESCLQATAMNWNRFRTESMTVWCWH